MNYLFGVLLGKKEHRNAFSPISNMGFDKDDKQNLFFFFG